MTVTERYALFSARLRLFAFTGLLAMLSWVIIACSTVAEPGDVRLNDNERAVNDPPSAHDIRNDGVTDIGSPLGGFPDVAAVVEKVAPSVVLVRGTVQQVDVFGRVHTGVSTGSGVAFDPRGYVLTNHHVVEKSSEIDIVLSNGQQLAANIVGVDPSTDLAVLKIDADEVNEFVIARLGDSNNLRIGDWVIAIGNPLGLEGSVTVGVVSAKGRSLSLGDGARLYDLVQTDAVINPGNSGGPLLNLHGEIIGINTAVIRGRLAGGKEADGIGFAVSTSVVIPVSEQIIANGRVIRPWLGVSLVDVTPVVAKQQNLSVDKGVLVVESLPGAPADKAGIQEKDVIVSIDGNVIDGFTDLQLLLLAEYSGGDKALVTVARSAVYLDIEIVLGERPE